MRRILTIFFFICNSYLQLIAQISGFPTLNEARSGFVKSFKVPTVKDYNRFLKGYDKHLSVLDRRGEKAYRKSFLKFIEIEDKLLETLCDSNEFRANRLMESAAASFGFIESSRNRARTAGKPLKEENGALKKLSQTAGLTEEFFPAAKVEDSKSDVEESTDHFTSRYYSEYMNKRLKLYPKTFEKGTKKQKRLLKKLKNRGLIWSAYKKEDVKLSQKFADKNQGIVRTMESVNDYKSTHSAKLDFSGTHAEEGGQSFAMLQTEQLLAKFKETIAGTGIIPPQNLEKITSVTDLLQELKKAKEHLNDSLISAMPDSLLSESKEKLKKLKEPKLDANTGKTFWDRLYGGIDFDWENETAYYPKGMGLTLTGGYKISEKSGLAVELNGLFNGEKLGWSEEEQFKSTLISNYTIGANIDYQVWKFIYAGAGAELLLNQLEAPLNSYFDEVRNVEYGIGLPLILRFLVPLAAGKSTNIEFRYDLNSKQNIKPQFDFKIGFLIGR